MEKTFKIAFAFAVLVFCLLVIGIFLLIIKIAFLFTPQIQLMGILMTPAAY